MKINAEQWAQLRAAVAADDQESFERKVQEWVRIAVSHERSHARRCDAVRSRERGERPYLASER